MLPVVLPARFGPFQLTRRLGQGGMAVVFEGYRLGAHGIHARVAVKCIRVRDDADESLLKMFINEAAVTVHLAHPNLIAVHEFNQEGGVYYLAMEYVDGYDLGVLLQICRARGARLPPRVALEILTQILGGLDHAHRARDSQGHPLDLIHRDLKPANIFITRGGMVKVADFGIAKATTSMIDTETGLSKGTPAYMSREQLDGQSLTPASDLFSLGLVLFETLTGERLLKETSLVSLVMALVRMDLDDVTAALPPDVQAFAPILRCALAQDPEDRYQSARDMLKDVRALEDALPEGPTLAELLEDLATSPDEARRIAALSHLLEDPQAQKTVASDPSAESTARGVSPFEAAAYLTAAAPGEPPPEGMDPQEVSRLFQGATGEGAGLQEILPSPRPFHRSDSRVVSLLHDTPPDPEEAPPEEDPLLPEDEGEPPPSMLFQTPALPPSAAPKPAPTPQRRRAWPALLLLALGIPLALWRLSPAPDAPPEAAAPAPATEPRGVEIPPAGPPEAPAPSPALTAEAPPPGAEGPRLSSDAAPAPPSPAAPPAKTASAAAAPPPVAEAPPQGAAPPAKVAHGPGTLKLNIIPAHERFRLDDGAPQAVPFAGSLSAGVHAITLRCTDQGDAFEVRVKIRVSPGREDIGVWDCVSRRWFKAPAGLMK